MRKYRKRCKVQAGEEDRVWVETRATVHPLQAMQELEIRVITKVVQGVSRITQSSLDSIMFTPSGSPREKGKYLKEL